VRIPATILLESYWKPIATVVVSVIGRAKGRETANGGVDSSASEWRGGKTNKK
jgi:hypothetical protein